MELLSGLRLRRAKHLRRQGRVEERGARRQASAPAPLPAAAPSLRKHHSYPQFARATSRRMRPGEPQAMRSLLKCAVTVIDRRASASGEPSEASEPAPPRASHTPAVRSGPPLSCNFCWNTVDECGRILRRKTQYHCPECRANLCIVPCFHEYHEAGCEPPARAEPPAVR